MKWWIIGSFVGFLVLYFGTPLIFGAMKKHDFDTLYYGLQDAKRSSGAYVDNSSKKKHVSYGERFARGEHLSY